MRRYTVLPVITLAFFVMALAVVGQSPDALLGTWKVNYAKSTYSPPSPEPTPQSQISAWESSGGGQFKNTIDVVDAKGQQLHLEINLRFDGADYAVNGAAAPTTRSYKRIDDSDFEFVEKVDGKVTTTSRSVGAPDGKTRTLTVTGTNAQGQTVKNVVLWEKQ